MSFVLLFSADDGSTGTEVWLTDADGTGATLVDLNPGPGDSFAGGGLAFGAAGLFAATDGVAGRELFLSDGTVSGTLRLADLSFGPDGSVPSALTLAGGLAYFGASTPATGSELYVTDGTAAGTRLVRDMTPGATGSIPTNFVTVNGVVLFDARDATSGFELFRTDGTEAGTQRLVDINVGANGSNPLPEAGGVLNGSLLFFGADNGTQGEELWVTDATAAGTRLVRDIRVGAESSGAGSFTAVGNTMFFLANDGASGRELWRTDGTEGGTDLVRDINPGLVSSNISEMIAFGNRLLFAATNGTNGRELWVTDGTTAGTRLLTDIAAGAGSSTPSGFLAAGERVYFSADNGTAGRELWVTDGTTAGTRLVQDVRVGAQGSAATPVVAIDINVAPAALALSAATLAESAQPGAVVGQVSASDADGDTLTFTLTDDAGGRFRLAGTSLQLATGLDFEAAGSHQVTVRATDPAGLFTEQVFTVTVTNVNEAPSTPALSEAVVEENSAAGTIVGVLSASDPEGGAVTYSLTANAGGRFTVVGDELRVAGPLIFDSAGSHKVTVRATDALGLSTLRNVTITVADVNEAPATPVLSASSVVENSAAGSVVGSLAAADPEGGAVGLVLTDDAGGRFALAGNQLVVAGPLDFETATSHQISVRATDAAGLTSVQTFTIAVTNDAGDDPVNRVGDGGNNLLAGNRGNDFLDGRGGNDTLRGNEGNDTLRGGDGTDTLNGGSGDDFIFGGDTVADLRDVVFAGAGNDSVDAGYGNDLVFGEDGNDTIEGGFGADELQGQGGDDVLSGSALGDLLFGGFGNDFLNGGFGSDRMNGGAGADRFFHTGVAGHGSDWIQDYSAAAGDVLVLGRAGATRAQLQVNITTTPGAGDGGVQEAFVIYRPTGQILWALVDGAGQADINVQIGGQVFDLI